MDRETFASRFASSAARARDFAQTLVLESLPRDLLFRVRLNSSNDRNASPEAVVYPEDSAYERANALRRCSLETVIDTLWRDGRVPEWINLSAIDTTDDATLVEVVCCGRFTADDDRLYHQQEGAPPFHVLGMTLPADNKGEQFSIHHRKECWDRDDLARLHAADEKVRTLELLTDEFDDDGLAALPDLPALEVLLRRRGSLRGSGAVREPSQAAGHVHRAVSTRGDGPRGRPIAEERHPGTPSGRAMGLRASGRCCSRCP